MGIADDVMQLGVREAEELQGVSIPIGGEPFRTQDRILKGYAEG
jgi:hypothetical protein